MHPTSQDVIRGKLSKHFSVLFELQHSSLYHRNNAMNVFESKLNKQRNLDGMELTKLINEG